MHRQKQKLLPVLACVSALAATTTLGMTIVHNRQMKIVRAATNSVAARSYGADVSVYQNSNVANVAKNGGQFVIVKVSEGTGYRNPKAAAQIASAKANNMMPMAYHFANFGANSSAAVNEGNYAVASAKADGLPAGSYIACDWESGDGNNVNGGKNLSANAILAFMNQVKAGGYQPLLYSGASLLNNNINTSLIHPKYPNALWVASYATMGQINTPNFAYFPSMNDVAIWQFTDNWRGLNIDGNITLLPLSYNNASTQAPTSNTQAVAKQASVKKNKVTKSSAAVKQTVKMVMHHADVYNSKGQKIPNQAIAAYQRVTVLGGLVEIKGRKYYKIGDDRYLKLGNIDGKARTIKHNAYVYNNKGLRVKVPKLRVGTRVATFGNTLKLNGKRYYRIQKNRYVKKNNFK